MRRTASTQDRRAVGYVYGGSRKQRMLEYNKLKDEYGCYMRLASKRKSKKVLTYIRDEHSGNGIIVSLSKNNRTFESVV